MHCFSRGGFTLRHADELLTQDLTNPVKILNFVVEVGGEGTGSPDSHLVAEDLVQEESVPQPRVPHGLPVLQLAELGIEHRDEDQEVHCGPRQIQLGEGLKQLAQSDQLLLQVHLHLGEAGLEADLHWRGSWPRDSCCLAGVEVEAREEDRHHHVRLA